MGFWSWKYTASDAIPGPITQGMLYATLGWCRATAPAWPGGLALLGALGSAIG